MTRGMILWKAGIFLLCLLPLTLAAQFENRDLKIRKKVINNVIILPPAASLVKYGMKGGETLVAESEKLETGLSSVVGETLSNMGCNVMQDTFSPEALDQNPDLKYALSDLQTRYDKLLVLIKKKPKDVRDGRFSLGDEVANFSAGVAADALVFVRAKGLVTTTGRKAFTALTGMGVKYDHVALDISVVDAQSGAVLYFARPGSGGNFVDNPETMKDAIYDSFSKFTPNIPPRR